MRSMTTFQGRPSSQRRGVVRSAFTLIELMVVISIIVILIGLLGVAFSGALGTSKNAATASLMHNIQTGVQQFETDFGYLPPMIDGQKIAMESINDPALFAAEMKDHRYHSVYTLPLYLLGVGELAPFDPNIQPGEDQDRYDGKQGPGFRDPGPDHSWGGARDRANHKAKRTGRVYGPYLDIGDGEGVLRRAEMEDFVPPVGSNNPFEFFSDGGPHGENGDGKGDLFVIQDRWGQAIRYYKSWPTRQKVNAEIQSSLDKIPFELRNEASISQAITNPRTDPNPKADPLLDQDLIRAPYALLSAGPDKDFGDTDTDGVWLDEDFLLTQPIDKKSAVAKRIKDNIRTTP